MNIVIKKIGGTACSFAVILLILACYADADEKRVKQGDVIAGPLPGMKFVYISPGEFIMGSPEDEIGRWSGEGPQHQVTLTKGFYMQTTEVTQAQWKQVMGNNPSKFTSFFKNTDNYPVEKVSWDDVQEFIEKLNQETEEKYRLPTEAEWEYAARAGSKTAFANGGITKTGCEDDPNLSKMGWCCGNSGRWYFGNSGRKTHPVAEKEANRWGLYDMHGNVYEWVEDHWHSNYNGAPSNGSAWVDKLSSSDRVARGGSWANLARSCRSAYRNRWAADDRYYDLGFRLLREVEP